MIKMDESEMPSEPKMFRITIEDIERVGYSDGTAAWIATRCAHPSLPRGIVKIVDGEFRKILKIPKKVDKGSIRRRNDSRRPWFEQVRGLRTSGCERPCAEMRRQRRQRQPRQEAVGRQKPPVRGA